MNPVQVAPEALPSPWLCLGFLILATTGFLALRPLAERYPEPLANKPDWSVLPLLRVALGLSLIGASILGYLLTPNFALSLSTAGIIARIYQGLVGAILLCDRRGGWGVLALCLLLPLPDILEHADTIGLALLLVLAPQERPTDSQMFVYARAMVGLAFVTLGLTEKLLQPELALAFLQTHSWNLLSPLGVSDGVFVCCAGAVEVLLGLLLIGGVYPRVCGFSLLALMGTTTLFGGALELIGHMPLLVFAYALLVSRASRRAGLPVLPL